MKGRIFTLLLLVGVLYALLILVPKLDAVRLPDNHRGFQPEQPIAYSHRLHAGELQIDCEYCHSGARRSRHAGIPAVEVCMNCHSYVTATRAQVRAAEAEAEQNGQPAPTRVMSPEISKLYRALDLSDDGDPLGGEPSPVEWVRIHQLPDFAAFDHRPHVAAEVPCQSCHGAVESMERVRQVESLSMGFCVNCHRLPAADGRTLADGQPHPQASTDCATCHY